MLFLLSQGGGLLLFLFSHQVIIKSVVYHFDRKNEIIQNFHFTLNKFNSIKLDKKEFIWNGDIYDIKELFINGNDVFIKAKKDKLEKRILSFLYQKDSDSGSSSALPILIKKLLSQVFIIVESAEWKNNISKGFLQQIFNIVQKHFKAVFFDVLKPPMIIQ